MHEVIQPICRKPETAAVVWRKNKLLSSYVFIYPADITFSVYVFRGSLRPDASHMHDIDVDLNVGKVQKVKFLWNNNVINLFRPKLGASRITVQSGEDRAEWVPFIPSKFYFLYLAINVFTSPSMRPITHLPTHLGIHRLIHSSSPFCSSTYLSTHPSSHLSRPVSSPFWLFSHPSIHLPNSSSQLSIYPSNLLWKINHFP